MPKRIAIDATPLFYPGNGVWRVTSGLIQAVLRLKSDYEFRFFARRVSKAAGSGVILPDGTSLAIRQLRLPRFAAEMAKPLGWLESLTEADLFHATDHYLPVKSSTRTIVTIHDLVFMLAPEKHFARTHAYFTRVVPQFARNCRRIISISEQTRRDIVERLGVPSERIDVIPWAVDRGVFSPEADEQALRVRLRAAHGIDFPYYYSVSCSEDRKNTPRLLEAYASLVGKRPQRHLVLRWDPPAAIREKYQSGELARTIHFAGKVSDAGLADLYRGATALFFPSLYEGFGLPVLEAMSCGTPVVTSNTSSMPEVGGSAARYVDPHSVESIRQAFVEFEDGSMPIEDLRRRGLARANEFSWERTARMTLEAYVKCWE